MDRDREFDPGLQSELRETAGREIVEEAAEDERMTEIHRRRSLTMADQGKEFVNRGDRVSVEFGGHSFSGLVVAAGSDYVTVNGPGQAADIKLVSARWSILPSDLSNESGTASAESFKALLHDHSASARIIRLALPGEDMVIGKVSVVADDHVEMTDVDDRKLIIPLDIVLAVVRSADSQ